MWEDANWQPTAGDVILAGVIQGRVNAETPVKNKADRELVARECLDLAETIMDMRAERMAEAVEPGSTEGK